MFKQDFSKKIIDKLEQIELKQKQLELEAKKANDEKERMEFEESILTI